jgi:tripeptidyl-peptidase-1
MKADSSAKAAKTESNIGTCLFYSEVESLVHSPGNISSGGSIKPPVPTLYPSWPASSPWVTAVGATRFVEDSSAVTKEAASSAFGSGGGFSRMFSAPTEQRSAIASYFSTVKQLPPLGSFPTDGRGTPDVAALGEGYQVLADGQLLSVGGTSASAPVFAGLVSLLNEARLQAGKPAMGFLNPWLYANEDAFSDITEGDNFIGRGNRLDFGFNCSAGWDPVTGLGTPAFDRMLDAAMASVSGSTFV